MISSIIWTDFAMQNLKQIFDYFAFKANRKIAHKIRNEILYSTRNLINHPKSGQIELLLKDFQFEYRYIICGNYKVIYRIAELEIIISDVFDVRQNPSKINNENRLKN